MFFSFCFFLPEGNLDIDARDGDGGDHFFKINIIYIIIYICFIYILYVFIYIHIYIFIDSVGIWRILEGTNKNCKFWSLGEPNGKYLGEIAQAGPGQPTGLVA